MAKAGKTIRIRWVRSGTGFDRKQKKILESLGLRRLRHVVERPDNPETRGLIARVPHLVEVVVEREETSWASTPEYKILPQETGPGLGPQEPLEELQAAVVAADSEATAVPETAAEQAAETTRE